MGTDFHIRIVSYDKKKPTVGGGLGSNTFGLKFQVADSSHDFVRHAGRIEFGMAGVNRVELPGWAKNHHSMSPRRVPVDVTWDNRRRGR